MQIYFDGEFNVLTIDGARIALDALATLAKPDPRLYYRLMRVGETVHVLSYTASEVKDVESSRGMPVLSLH